MESCDHQTRGQRRWASHDYRLACKSYYKTRYACDDQFREKEKERKRNARMRKRAAKAIVCTLKEGPATTGQDSPATTGQVTGLQARPTTTR